MNKVSVVIPVYKNVDEFVRNLLHNRTYLSDCEIIIVNDDPSSHFPADLAIDDKLKNTCTFINNAQNKGFSPSVNIGVGAAQGELIFLKNSDVVILDDSWRTLPPYFDKDPQLFAIGVAQQERNGRIVGRNEIYFNNGLFHHHALPVISQQDLISETPSSKLKTKSSSEGGRRTTDDGLLSTAWAEGGASLIRKHMWDALGGMDEAYAPFYWEDVDLSYRAYKKGWKSMFAPFVIVKHEHESTIGTHFAHIITPTAYRNQLRFTHTHARGLQRLGFYWYLVKSLVKKSIVHRVKHITHNMQQVR